MGRPAKSKLEATEGIADQSPSNVSVNVESFIRIRDSVVTGLATIQDAIATLSAAYIKHSNAILGEQGSALDVENALSGLQRNSLFGPSAEGQRQASPAKSPAADGKKEKKKRIHDPNAPKRPLTPYFLYMQTARPIIASDLGAETAKGAVSTEGVRRWNAMAAPDKLLWTQAYTENLKLYNARMHSYKSGNQFAKDMADEEALAYADHHNIGAPAATEVAVDAQLHHEALLDAPAEEDDELPAPIAFTPQAKASRNKKVTTSAPTPQQNVAPPSSGKAAPAPEAASGTKRKRSKKGEEPVTSIEQADTAAETPKPKGRSKKHKA